ncbi:MAG: hypothetical protein GY953_13095, partial [bacterium]|nr:hypothetical protein [bacterium]
MTDSKCRLSAFCLALIVLLLLATTAAGQLPSVRVGMVQDGPWERNEEVRETFQREIRTLLDGEFDVSFPAGSQLTADYTSDGIRAAFES